MMKAAQSRVMSKRAPLVFAAWITWASTAAAQTAPTPYTATWASIDSHTAAPTWFQDAKFGIYYHWGAFSTPAFYSEWYPGYMYDKQNNSGGVYQHHMQVYGDPFSDWPYQKFLIGANDKMGRFTLFAPKLVTNGGQWDPDAWATLIANSGARFAGPVAEHHDGFSMWDSKVNPWNSVDYGPKLNLGALHAAAIRKKGLKFYMSFHTAYNFMGYWQFVPPQTDPKLQQLFGQLPKDREEAIWLEKLKEVIHELLPDITYHDASLNGISETNLLAYCAYYYNAAVAKGVEVVILGKDGLVDDHGTHPGQVYDYERGGTSGIKTPYWSTDDSVSPQTWGYVDGMTYYTENELLDSFVDHVSKGGTALLNIAPTADGTIPQAQQDILNAFGSFLHQNGEAIYKTRTWINCCEGPTMISGGYSTFLPTFTASDVRYTRSQDSDAVYALVGGWPGSQLTLKTPTTSAFPVGSGKVFLFPTIGGTATSLTFTQDGSGLHVTLPGTAPYPSPVYAFKITKSGTAPMTFAPWPPDSATAEASDAGAIDDAGGAPDANAIDGAGGAPDASAGGDGALGGQGGSGSSGAQESPSSPAASSGCGCSTPGSRARANEGLLTLLGFVVARALRRGKHGAGGPGRVETRRKTLGRYTPQPPPCPLLRPPR